MLKLALCSLIILDYLHKTLYDNTTCILVAVYVIHVHVTLYYLIAGKPYKPHFLIGKLRNFIVEVSYETSGKTVHV